MNDSLNKNTISLKLHNRTEKKIIIIEFNFFGEIITILVHFFLYKYCWQYLYTSIAIIKFKRSHIENKFRQLDIFTFNLSNFFNEMFSLQRPFLNWIVNIRLSIIYLLCACRVQSVAPDLNQYWNELDYYIYLILNIYNMHKINFNK
jgi:hypothetical protein